MFDFEPLITKINSITFLGKSESWAIVKEAPADGEETGTTLDVADEGEHLSFLIFEAPPEGDIESAMIYLDRDGVQQVRDLCNRWITAQDAVAHKDNDGD